MSIPLLLVAAGHDPVHGAGLTADLATAMALGVPGVSLVTALTAQDTANVAAVWPTAPDTLRRMADVLLADVRPTAVKIGLLAEAGVARALGDALARHLPPGIPWVLDPVLRAGGGRELAQAGLASAILDDLGPRLAWLTPNAAEARRLAGTDDAVAAGRWLAARGAARNVLVTGGDEDGETVVDRWHRADGTMATLVAARLPGRFHGAGCALSSALAAGLAQGLDDATALDRARAWTRRALSEAFSPGRGRSLPGRPRWLLRDPGA